MTIPATLDTPGTGHDYEPQKNHGSEENLGKSPTLDTYKSYHFDKYNKEHNIMNEHNIPTTNTLDTGRSVYHFLQYTYIPMRYTM